MRNHESFGERSLFVPFMIHYSNTVLTRRRKIHNASLKAHLSLPFVVLFSGERYENKFVMNLNK